MSPNRQPSPSTILLLAICLLPFTACATNEPATPDAPQAAGPVATQPIAAAGPAIEGAADPSAGAPERAVGAPEATISSIQVPQPAIALLAESAALGDDTARAELARLSAELDGAAQDQAALALGGLLISDESWREALGPLREAADGEVAPDYAALLFARAVVRGQLADAVDEARTLLAPVVAGADTPFLAAEARLRAFQLETLAGAWPEAARQGLALLAATPPPDALDEVRWLTAEALRLSGRTDEAVELYRAIWRETPGSARAREGRERLAAAGVEVEPPEGAERLAWIEAMQSAGLHREALAELAPLAAAGGDPELRRQALAAEASSHFVLRENQRVVEVAETLRREAPASAAAAEAALQAMRALGRDDRVAEIRAWEEWLRATHPASPTTAEARYYLAAILAGTPGEETAGRDVLREIAAAGGERAADALWRIAWVERGLGDDAAAREALERLLASDTGSGYRAASLYWLARLAEPPEAPRAIELYRTVRRELPRDYYATAAAERLRELGVEPGTAGPGSQAAVPPASAAPPLPPPDPLTDPTRRPEPAYRRAVELAALGLPRLAAAELATLDLDADPAAALGLARLHHRGGDTWSAIRLLLARFDDELTGVPLGAPGVPREVWETLYPFPYREQVADAVARAAAPGAPLDPWLVASLARRESLFWRRAASAAGAVGVMQLVPPTAARVAESLGLPAPDRAALFDPELNVALGTAELARLIAAFDGHRAPALAAYNAGETVAREWWEARPPGQPLDEWIETIPYTETRLYVKAILGTHPLYRTLYPEAGG